MTNAFTLPFIIALLVILSACGGSTSSNAAPTQPNTPQTVQTTPQLPATPTPTPTPTPTNSTDWTTYHANNQRTGYRWFVDEGFWLILSPSKIENLCSNCSG